MMTRRKFLALAALALPSAVAADACLIEPTSLRVSRLTLNPQGTCRFAHFSDFHHKGDVGYAAEVVRTINELAPEFVCFTGDLVEDKRYASEALSFIRQINAPVYGAPGNHDYRCGASFLEYEQAFAATGGGWLENRAAVIREHDLELVGMGAHGVHKLQPPQASRRVLLLHYPAESDLVPVRFDLILAGHSHGGQVRLPFWGALVLPWGVGRYDLGYFMSKAGPIYVNAGIGTFYAPIRFNCRPEITLVTM